MGPGTSRAFSFFLGHRLRSNRAHPSSFDGKTFIVKDAFPDNFEYQKSLQQPLSSCPNLRALRDTIPGDDMFVIDYLAEDLLSSSKRPLSDETRRDIVKRALTGLAELHERGILHTGTSEVESLGSQQPFETCGWLTGLHVGRHQAQQHSHRLYRDRGQRPRLHPGLHPKPLGFRLAATRRIHREMSQRQRALAKSRVLGPSRTGPVI